MSAQEDRRPDAEALAALMEDEQLVDAMACALCTHMRIPLRRRTEWATEPEVHKVAFREGVKAALREAARAMARGA